MYATTCGSPEEISGRSSRRSRSTRPTGDRARERHELRPPRLDLSRDVDTAIKTARAIRAGTVSINGYSEGDVTTPFGGYKESGFGGRDQGLEAFDQYTEKKTIWFTVG